MALVQVAPEHPPRHRFTVADYYAMGEAGVLGPETRTELLDGEIYDMVPPGPEHEYSTGRLGNDLKDRLGSAVLLRMNAPLHLDDGSEPQPDLLLLRPVPDRYRRRHPAPSDTFLIVEVSRTTLRFDREQKLPAYARCGVPELWIVNQVEDAIEAYGDPSGGAYRQHRTYRRGQHIAPGAFPDCRLSVDEILG